MIQLQRAQAEARLGSARSFLLSGLAEIWDAVGETGELNLEQNTKIRLATTWAIDQAREVINTLYHSAGATAIFDNRPFERRFRDMHTASQQARDDRRQRETIGRVLLASNRIRRCSHSNPPRIAGVDATTRFDRAG